MVINILIHFKIGNLRIGVSELIDKVKEKRSKHLVNFHMNFRVRSIIRNLQDSLVRKEFSILIWVLFVNADFNFDYFFRLNRFLIEFRIH